MKHILMIYCKESKKAITGTEIEIAEEVFEWLQCHDISITSKGETLFPYNQMTYIYQGPKIELKLPLTNYQA